MKANSRLLSSISQKLIGSDARKLTWSQCPRRQLMVLRQASSLHSKFDPVVESTPLTNDRAYELLVSLTDGERTALKTALEKYESQKIKEGFVGVLAKTRWRSRFGRPTKMHEVGQVDPTGSYCAMPDDFLKKKLVEIAKPPAPAELRRLFLINAIPFIGFGFLDNFIMIIAGDSIENVLGIFMCISTMAAAALGNTISDILGIGSAYYIERVSDLMGFKPPKLTEYQLEMKSSRKTANAGRVIGITIGCLLGMLPLFFMDNKSKDEKDESKTENTKATTSKSEHIEPKRETTNATV